MTLSEMKKYIIFLWVISAPLFARAEGLRIVSLGPYVTENISLLGMEKNIVGLTVHDSPGRKKGKEIIGTLLEPNIEKILALKPGIVIGSKEGNRPESLEKLRQLGVKTLVLDQLHTFEDICNNLVLLGNGLNESAKAGLIVREQRLRLEKIRQQAEKAGSRKRVFFILGFKPLFTTGCATYINGMIESAGGRNVFDDVNKKWFPCSVEEVIRRNPQVIVFLRMEEESVILWERLRDTAAVKQKKIEGIEPTVIGSPTPASFVDSVETLYKMMYLNTPDED